MGAPTDRAVAKVVRVIDEHARRFIAHAPFVFVASAGADGMLDVSPKGDPAGFVKVLDERTLAIPDRPGNRRLDTFRNVLSNPNVGLIFVIPGVTYTLRVAGKALPEIALESNLLVALALYDDRLGSTIWSERPLRLTRALARRAALGTRFS